MGRGSNPVCSFTAGLGQSTHNVPTSKKAGRLLNPPPASPGGQIPRIGTDTTPSPAGGPWRTDGFLGVDGEVIETPGS